MRALGSAYALMGRVADGTALLEGAVALAESINLRVAESNSLVLLGEAHLLAGRTDDALVAGTRALAMARGAGSAVTRRPPFTSWAISPRAARRRIRRTWSGSCAR